MKLMLPDPIFNPTFKLGHKHKLFFIGSCFAESMSTYFTERKFSVNQNPFGILFNPISIANCIEQITHLQSYEAGSFYENNGIYASWHHHSNMGEQDLHNLKKKLELVNEETNAYLQQTDVAFITLGTAWVYWHKELDMVVANNLRAPMGLFERRLLKIVEISDALRKTIDKLKSRNKDIKIVLTVSPVRHSKQGLIENNRSKARLLEAVHSICEDDDSLSYLPSYEIVMDVLRDYRFCGKDFVHPNKLATDYLWSFIMEHFVQESDKPILEEVHKIRLAMHHKLRNTESVSGQQFIQQQIDRIQQLCDTHLYLDLSVERNYFETLLL